MSRLNKTQTGKKNLELIDWLDDYIGMITLFGDNIITSYIIISVLKVQYYSTLMKTTMIISCCHTEGRDIVTGLHDSPVK